MKKFFKPSLTLLLPAVLFSIAANAQKLPKIQVTSVAAPANIKVDGKTTEWNNKFQAFNRTTEVYYTLSNSATKLYLTIQSDEQRIIRKITSNGITLTIMADPKQNKDGLAVTFPAYAKTQRPVYFNLKDPYLAVKDTNVNNTMADSVMNAYNATLDAAFKAIGVTGEPTIPDSTLSVFNTEGFKAVARFNRKLVYTYELAIPLSYIKFAADKPGTFKYMLQVNGPPGEVRVVDDGRRMVYTAGDGTEVNIGYPGPNNLGFANPTNFTGEYTLAK
ncbi:hypothetical protein FO440_08325 [Mucilaginibacter corticis]|uniref:DUF4384 domain-containing protein n=1 Tax=Mucilaginibacter corticis TaxID=2597670 RepID=A0A556MW50_9SPHI|nr:hypothetical protein [Mucilaginibacter corticis]TSJ44164.1 hypothetical protein FO440_08325 [Mucilaginibacter corticis]